MSRRILLVDDDRQCGMILSKLLQRAGCAAVVATSVAEAKQACRKADFDLIVSDILMPDGNPLPLLERCRERRSGVKGIVLSGYDDPLIKAQARDAGYEEYMLKPMDFGQFMSLIRRLVPE
jgi:two-component system nitrogen regulation response regulator GlnG